MTEIIIDKNKKGNTISPLLYGIFFEDINYGGDGGLYGELIVNRSFKFYDRDGKKEMSGLGWELLKSDCGIVNLGYNQEGFYAQKDAKFKLKLIAQAYESTKLLAAIIDKDEKILSSTELILKKDEDFINYEAEITSLKEEEFARLALILPEGGDVEFKYVSLFNKDTFCGRDNGMRKDLAEKLKALSPKFMRFPGGCIVEGRSFENMYRWKDTIGPVEERKVNFNRWQMEEYQQEKRDSSDYFQSYGIGFFEYFQLCEDLGCEPLPVINCGMTCQWHEALLTPMDELDSFIQDAVDLVEFANGDKDTKWGKIRCQMGHENAFNLKFIGIGNEQWGRVYFERYEAFEKVLKAKCPEIKLITCAGWDSEGTEFQEAYKWMNENKDKAYAVDEHFYKSPDWFLKNIHRYDNYDRSLPKVFAGEYASHTAGEISERKNNLYAALTEAAFLTGVEKNADHVVMTSYAPLFAKEGHQQWQPDLIWFNNKESYGSPSYYVQKLFSENTGKTSLEITNIKELEAQNIFVSASEEEESVIVKIVNLNGFDQDVSIKGLGNLPEKIKVSYIGGDKEACNSFAEPERITIREELRGSSLLKIHSNEVLIFKI